VITFIAMGSEIASSQGEKYFNHKNWIDCRPSPN